MADFTVRVELHGAEWEDYDALRVEMEAEGFSAVVQGSDGMAYELPAGEYAVTGDATRQQVLARARRSADRFAGAARSAYGYLGGWVRTAGWEANS